MPEYENDPEDVDEDDNGLPALSGLATNAEVSFMERHGASLSPISDQLARVREFFEHVQLRDDTEFADMLNNARETNRRWALEQAKSRCKAAWIFSTIFCGLTLVNVVSMAFGPGAVNVAMVVLMGIWTGWHIKGIRIAHEEYEEELNKPAEEW